MKKILSVLLLALLLFSASAGAENMDFESMSMDELISIKNAITNEIYSRLDFAFDNAKIGAGYYHVGKDIKVGRYEFICTSAEMEGLNTGSGWSEGIVCVTSSADEDAEIVFKFDEVQVGEKYKFELEEGQVLVIARCNGLIQEYDHSWAP